MVAAKDYLNNTNRLLNTPSNGVAIADTKLSGRGGMEVLNALKEYGQKDPIIDGHVAKIRELAQTGRASLRDSNPDIFGLN